MRDDIVVDLLLNNGATTGYTLDSVIITYSSQEGYHKVVDVLLQHGANVDVVDKWQMKLNEYTCGCTLFRHAETALIKILRYKNSDNIVDMLLKNGADPDAVNEWQMQYNVFADVCKFFER